MMILGPNQQKWLEALEGGQFPQATFALRKDDGFCCLGAACELFKTDAVEVGFNEYENAFTYEDNWESAPAYVRQAIALSDDMGSAADGTERLADLNDGGKTFKEIAAIIRAKPENYFTAEV